MMRRLAVILFFVLAARAWANPVVFDPVGTIAYTLVLGSAVAIETGAVTLTLLFWGTDPKPVYLLLAVGNLIVYFAVFLPLLEYSSDLRIAELAVVVVDGILIKMVTLLDRVRDDSFRPLRWGYAFLFAAIGNLVSYYVGFVATG